MFLLTVEIKKNDFIVCDFDNLDNALEHLKRLAKKYDLLSATIEKGEKKII